jgi:hypothetical protein
MHAGFKDLILITDRGYESLRNLEKYILRGQSMIMCVKAGQKDVSKAIKGLGEFGVRPVEMVVDSEAMIYHTQYDIEYAVESTGQAAKMSDRLKLNLYFDPVRRDLDLMELDIALSFQEATLGDLLKNKAILSADTWIKREFCYYKVVYDPVTRVIKSYERNENKISKVRSLSGFFAIMTHGVDYDAITAFRTYRLRDEQEKYFQQMKDQMSSDRQRNWSEEGKTGRLFILFVSLILSSYVRHIWKSTRLHELFHSSLDILDEMRPIRLIEHINKAKVVTPFIGAQVDICETFGLNMQDGCAPTYVSRQKPIRKRGRPLKKTVIRDS